MKEVPIWEKSNLSLEEAAAYSGIGINKLRDMTNDQNCRIVLLASTSCVRSPTRTGANLSSGWATSA
mgnify:CR=1 FL=1